MVLGWGLKRGVVDPLFKYGLMPNVVITIGLGMGLGFPALRGQTICLAFAALRCASAWRCDLRCAVKSGSQPGVCFVGQRTKTFGHEARIVAAAQSAVD